MMFARSTVPSLMVTGTSFWEVVPYTARSGVHRLPGAKLAATTEAGSSGFRAADPWDPAARATPADTMSSATAANNPRRKEGGTWPPRPDELDDLRPLSSAPPPPPPPGV